MSTIKLTTGSFLVGALLTLFAACAESEAGDSSDPSEGTGSILNTGGTLGAGSTILASGGSESGGIETGSGAATTGSTSGSSGGPPSTGGDSSTGSVEGTGNVGNESAGGAGSTDGSGGEAAVGNEGNEGGQPIDIEPGVGGTFDPGVGGTFDPGVGGTIDPGTGGTIDPGTGGTIDPGTGGTVDPGTGGTYDLPCIPTCVPDVLGVGEEAVNLVVFEDAVASGCDTEGRMWVGGDATLSGYGVGAQLSDCDRDGYVLVVGGDLDANGGIKGRVWVGGDLISGTAQCGGVWSETPGPVDFEFIRAHLTAYSHRIGEYEPTGTVAVGSPTVFTADDPVMNIFTISAADLSASNGFKFNVPVSSTVIVNVMGTGEAGFINGTTTLPDGVTCGSGAVSLNDFCNQLVWNFPEATSVTVSGTAVQGSILAPHAAMTSNGSGQVNGTVIVREFKISSCVEMHPHYFNGCLCTETGPYACCP
ncbi:MAG: choice-of-anchor A family protein [Polyangiaceae bacterium]|nr:choice-of-anchor A family protein [Polyangiaceae bacterium]